MTSTPDTHNELLQCDDPLDFIVENLDIPISVEASAGCGKTYTLIARVCKLLQSGQTTIDRLLLLTFTENAAAEMKSRLVEILRENESELWARAALENLHRSSIQTLHSFAYEICKQFHDSLGLPDDITISDPLDEERNIRTFFNAHYDAWGNDPELLTFFSICKLLGITRLTLRTTFQQLNQKITFIPGDKTDQHNSLETSDAEKLLHLTTNNVRRVAENLIHVCQKVDFSQIPQGKIARVENFLELAAAIMSAHEDISVAEILAKPEKYIKTKKFTIAVAKSSPPQYREVEDGISLLGEAITSGITELTDNTLRFAIAQLYELSTLYRATTFSSGRITFDDSIIAARRAIEIESIREQLWSRYDSIIVDEFQDTDIHQLAILDSLASEASSGDLARIFVVGDEKQSIYGFRGATVEGYKDFVRTRPITRVALSLSRRTVPSAINAINTISHELIDDYLMLRGTREDIDSSENYHVKIIGGEMEDNIDSVREVLANETVATLVRMHDSSLVSDKATHTNRVCTYSDMTILIRDKNSLPSITQALEDYSVPYSIDSSALVWELTMIRTFLAVLIASSQPRNGYAIIGALKTPVFSITNDDISEYVSWAKKYLDKGDSRRVNVWDFRNSLLYTSTEPRSEQTQKVIAALGNLHALHNALAFLIPSQVVHHLLFETDFFRSFVAALGESHGVSVVRFLLHDVISWEDSHGMGSVSEYITHLENKRANSVRSDSYIDNTHEDRVRIMTMHSSKGLEFPIVAFIPSQSTSRDRHVSVVDITEEGKNESFALSVSSKIYDSRLNDYKEELKDRFLEEESRLTYVGLTRAQDHLIIPVHHKKVEKPTNQAARIDRATRDITRFVPSIVVHRPLSNEGITTPRDAIGYLHLQTSETFHQKATRRENIRNAILSSQSINATSMKPEEFISVNADDRKMSFLAESVAPSIGKAVHRVMNIIDFNADPQTIELVSRRCALNEGVMQESDIKKCIDMVARALSIPLLTQADVEIQREVPISGFIEGIFCEGYIDCLVKTKSGYIILDYKTDSIDEKRPLETKVQLHAFQLAFYSLLLKENTRCTQCDAALLFLNHESMPYVEITNLNENEKLVKEKLISRAGGVLLTA